MIFILIFLLWFTGFLAHEIVQPRTRKLIALSPLPITALRYVRFLLPGAALLLSLHTDWQTGVMIWLGLGACAGIVCALSLALWRQNAAQPDRPAPSEAK
ncbi:hypothetical protein [Acetobacter thailandicus]|uniref:hypothetical protein n=1 Tax=Acetobacter thailandicus TaxID=1502842 RepID=UPI001BA7A346|nr:hypothetical protein [Acetobacter thailandicus]MBS0960580.1 hypothetical protein [Acetobacter thailandicus]